jgi:hypothetical protein
MERLAAREPGGLMETVMSMMLIEATWRASREQVRFTECR